MTAVTDPARWLCTQLEPRLIGTLTLYCGDRGVAEELAQETLVRLLDRWEQVRALDHPAAWAHRVAINLANSRFRRLRAERRARQRLAGDRAPEGVVDVAAQLAVRRAVAAPRPRTSPGQLRELVRRRRRRRRVAQTVGVVVLLTVVGVGAALLLLPRTDRIEFAGTPGPSDRPTASPAPTREPTAQPAPSPSPSASTTTAPAPAPVAPTPDPAPSGCGGHDHLPERPEGATRKTIPDVDGDGQRDTMYLTSERVLGIISSTGADVTHRVETASAVPISVLAVDTNATPPVEFLVSDGRSVQLLVFEDCRMRPVVNTRDGEPWVFDRGFRGNGTGVGCVDIAGRRELVGLNIEHRRGDTVVWSRTIVHLDGHEATVGATERGTFTRPGDDHAIDLLSQITCGRLTMTGDAIAEPHPEG